MRVQEIMGVDPACCAPSSTLMDAAKLMADQDCGEIPVLDDAERVVGVVTDRDIACRGVAQGVAPTTAVQEVMTSPVVTATPDMSLDECCQKLENNQIRRMPVVDESGACCGMVSQADIALHAPEHEVAEVLRDVSKPVGQQL